MEIKQIAPFIAGIILVAVAGIVMVNWYNYRLKKRLLETGPLDDRMMGFIRTFWRPGMEALKWGLLLLGGGIGLIIIHFIPSGQNYLALDFGVEIILIAAALIAYYLLNKP